MRNLKKILALVLALVMSLSLMATASAAGTAAATDAATAYKTAVDVLTGLKVVIGDAGGIRENDPITRAEAATLIYRVHTADVTDSKVYLHTDHPFTDVASTSWMNSYVSYAHNAQIVKGKTTTTFEPGVNITGYETLAMTLRALGYGKNGEFEGPEWKIQTAAWSQRIGLFNGISAADSTDYALNLYASRGFVFQVMFNAVLMDQVAYSAYTPDGYSSTGRSMADGLHLEEIEGVVMANEYDSLTSTSTTKDGKTELDVDGKTYTLNTTTTLDDIGENRHAYIHDSEVLVMENVGNTVDETVDEMKVSELLDRAGLTQSDAEHYVNFGEDFTTWTSDWKIKYEVNLGPVAANNPAGAAGIVRIAQAVADGREMGFNLPDATDDPDAPTSFVTNKGPGVYKLVKNNDNDAPYAYDLVYSMEFKIREKIAPVHQSNIRLIFNIADKNNSGYIDGEVYYGTTSTRDASDEMTLNAFIKDYINTDDSYAITDNENGNWLKVIDNDGDGVADYVLKTIYTIAQVTRVKDDVYTLDVKNHTLWNEDVYPSEECDIDDLNTLTSQKVVANGDIDVDDVVYYAVIDGKAQTYPTTVVPSVNIDKYVRSTKTVTTTDGVDYIKSDVCEHIEDEAYQSAPELLAGKVNYDLFLVRGDYLGAFVKSSLESDYVLITDGWFNSTKAYDEYAVRVYDEDSDRTDKQEIVDLNENGELFIDRDVQNYDGSSVQNNDWGALKYLGDTNGLDARDGLVGFGTYTAATLNGGKVTNNNLVNRVRTTVAAITADGTILPVEDSSVSGRYSQAMIDLTDLTKVPTRAAVDGEVYYTSAGSDTAYNARWNYSNGNVIPVTVRAQSSTIYYVVYPDASTSSGVMVTKAVGYSNAPDVAAWVKKGYVEDIYAVGTRRTADNDIDVGYEYTADIVVIELNNYDASNETVLVLDDNVKLSDTRYRELTIITEKGVLETRTIDMSKSTLSYGGGSTVGRRYVEPGLYRMSTTSEKDIYVLNGQLTNAEIASKGGYTTGRVERVNWTNDRYVVIDPSFYAGSNTLYGSYGGDSDPEESQFDLTAETPLFRVSYDEETRYDVYGTANITEGVGADWDEGFLSAQVDRVNSNYSKASLVRDTSEITNHNQVYYNYNRVLIHHDGKGNVVYAVSFDKVADESGINNTNYNLVSSYNYAVTVWNNVMPAPAKSTDVIITFNLELDSDEGITVKKNAEDDGKHYGANEGPAELTVPKATADAGIVRFYIQEDAGTTLASVVPVNRDWTTTSIKPVAGSSGLWEIVLTKNGAGALKSMNAEAADEATATIWTVKAVVAVAAAVDKTIGDGEGELSLEAAKELLALLETIDEYAVNGYTAAGEAADTLEEKIQTTEDAADAALTTAKNDALDELADRLDDYSNSEFTTPVDVKTMEGIVDEFEQKVMDATTAAEITKIMEEAKKTILVDVTIKLSDFEEMEIAEKVKNFKLYANDSVVCKMDATDKKIYFSGGDASVRYTTNQILNDDELIKQFLMWNFASCWGEVRGSGTAADPWNVYWVDSGADAEALNTKGYVKDGETTTGSTELASDLIKYVMSQGGVDDLDAGLYFVYVNVPANSNPTSNVLVAEGKFTEGVKKDQTTLIDDGMNWD